MKVTTIMINLDNRKAFIYRLSPEDNCMFRKKRLSQNFLTDTNIAEKIVRLSGIEENDRVIEIGCGGGMLTQFLLRIASEVHGVEIDRDLWEPIKQRFSAEKNFILHEGDFMALPVDEILDANKRNMVIGNIPYHITTPILFRCLEHRKRIARIVLMVQREVAERILARPGKKEYGILSVIFRFYADVRALFHLPPHVFSPLPKVESTVLCFDLKTDLPEDFNYSLFHTVVRTSFNRRRKMLRNSIGTMLAGCECPVDLSERPERLSVDDFIRLTETISRSAKLLS